VTFGMPAERLANDLARQLEVRVDRLARVGSARRETIGDREQGDVGGNGAAGVEVAVELGAGERPTVHEKAEAQVVTRQLRDI
jgi:hypothetical protein